MYISKSITSTIVAKIIRRSTRRKDRKPVLLYVNEICLLLEKNPKRNYVFVIMLYWCQSVGTFCKMFLL